MFGERRILTHDPHNTIPTVKNTENVLNHKTKLPSAFNCWVPEQDH